MPVPDSRRRWLAPTIALLLFTWAAAILWLSLASHPSVSVPRLFSWDKARHAAAYALLALLALGCFRQWQAARRQAVGLAFAAAFLYGALIEGMQWALTETRKAEWGDLVANFIGAFVAVVVARLWIRRS